MSDHDDSDGYVEEMTNKAVDRGNKLTQTEKNKKHVKKIVKNEVVNRKTEKQKNHEFNLLRQYIKEGKLEDKRIEEGVKVRKELTDKEKSA